MKGRMKRIISLTIVLALMISSVAFGDIVSFEGGVIGDPTMEKSTYQYEELFFLAGEPVVLSGTVVVPDIPEDKDKYKLTYDYTLGNSEEKIAVTRSITYDVELDRRTDLNQTLYKAEISKFDEEIKVDEDTYTLGGYLFDKSMLYDNTPAVDYYSGKIYGKKTYYKNGSDATTNEGKVIVEMSTDTLIGYEHYWGGQETQIINHDILWELPNPDYDPDDSKSEKVNRWKGLVTLRMSATNKKDFQYIGTDPQNISFRGSYIMDDKKENILQYSYELPLVDDKGVMDPVKMDKGEKNIRTDLVTDSTSLIVPKYKDIGGHWAEDSIFLLSSLGLFDTGSSYFAPDFYITRREFARAISHAIADIEPLTEQEKIKLSRKDDAFIFYDVDVKDPDYESIKFVKDNGLMVGEAGGYISDYFYPDRPMRRSEIIQVMVNALGLENLAPMPPYKTHYVDDAEIPVWAKDAIYVANEIGLVTGFSDGTIRADAYVTNGEAAIMLEKLIMHIKDDITFDYREKIINKE